MNKRRIRIGCASGFWGDSAEAAPQLLHGAQLDYLVFDYLSEVTMSILARARDKDASLGYARDFVSPTMRSVLGDVAAQGVKVIANAGGINPRACRDALAAVAESLGLVLKIAIVLGDDLLPQREQLRQGDVRESTTGEPLPTEPLSINAYLGAEPVRAALAAGADVVITGRCVDSALVLGPLMHEFGWRATDLDKLASGSLAGHIIECGVQAVGGNFTDWRMVDGWDDMGYPIVDCAADGSFIVTKPQGTGGLVTPLTVAEQIVYEIGDPANYILPDVVCDFTQVTLKDCGESRVEVSGAIGKPATREYKVSCTYQDGFRSTAMFTMVGRDANKKIKRVGESILVRTRRLFAQRGLGDYRRTSLKSIGAEDAYGANARHGAIASREQVLRLDVHHDQAAALKIFASEIAPAGLAMGPGRCSLVGGRPGVTPLVRLYSFLWPKDTIPITVELGSQVIAVAIPAGSPFHPGSAGRPPVAPDPTLDAGGDGVEVTLETIAVARSGDKGNNANIGVVARAPEFMAWIKSQVTAEAVRQYFAHFVHGPVDRYEIPGFHALNYLLHDALDGGGVASLRNDPLGKCYAQMLLDLPVRIPRSFLTHPAIGQFAEPPIQ
ncbi:MAG TPA: acyclic terpene utilization AtuA family protein [Candidimonas sp.]|nr:acyclic terpene utilization AtuA family protein [Candidimonas sp.]